MRLQAGTLLHGDSYKIEKVLGQGSFGITYLAVHMALERKVCIKEFFMKEINTRNADGSITGITDGSLSYNYGQKFKKEALNLSRLDHPNIVRVTDSFEENGTYYYVMDYIDGDNLNDYLKGHEVTQKEALDIIRDVATALMYMHEEKKMLHLDLKPGNIMRRHGDGHIFLIDFGLSKHYSSNGQPETSTSIGLGTAGYAPIEQANQMKSSEFRPTIDVYALGATLFKLLTRETPPQASEIVSDDELIESKLRANGITGPIIDVVVNAMQPNVRKRTQSVKAFLDSLPYGTEEKPVKPKPKAKKKPTAKPKEESNGEETEVLGGSEKRKEQPFVEVNWRIPADYVCYPNTTAEKANNGDVDAMFAMGMMLLRGQGVGQSIESAQSYFQKAQALGDARTKKVLEDWEKLKKKYENTDIHSTKKEALISASLQAYIISFITLLGILGIFIADQYDFSDFFEYEYPFENINFPIESTFYYVFILSSICILFLFIKRVDVLYRQIAKVLIITMGLEILYLILCTIDINIPNDYFISRYVRRGLWGLYGVSGIMMFFKCSIYLKVLGIIFIINSLISFIVYYLLGHGGASLFLVLCFDFSYIIRFVAMWWILTRKEITNESN